MTALFALTAASAADAATVTTIRGAGWGHGIGMSQYGANGFAQNGSTYENILAHYYRGTELTRSAGAPVRVLLQPVDPYIRFRGASSAGGKELNPATTYVARPSRGLISLRTSRGKRVGRFASPITAKRTGHPLRLLGPALNKVNSGLYRGAIEISLDGRGLTAINVLGLDPYVKGVVPGEMPSTWQPEALKVQAVAARSYALATDKPGAFDQYPDVRSQVYRGLSGEEATTNAAVEETTGEILTYDGEPAVTYFFSTSGGSTENVENVFLGATPQPYLKGVDDPYDEGSPYHRWRLRLSRARMDSLLGGYSRGRFRKVKVLKRGVSPRIVRARVYGTGGTAIITGPTLRARLGLRDTWAYFSNVSSSQVRSRSARVALRLSLGDRRPVLLGGRRGLALGGRFDPAPRGRKLVVERRSQRRWVRTGRARTSKRGAYRVKVARAGTYRVRSGRVAGPAVRVR